jgi:hypothetical protein
VRIIATPCKGRDLQPGDLFSTGDQTYWNSYDPLSVGQKVYIRTQAPSDLFEDADEEIYRITIEREATV